MVVLCAHAPQGLGLGQVAGSLRGKSAVLESTLRCSGETSRGLPMGISSFDSRLGVRFAHVQMMTTPRGLPMGISSFDCRLGVRFALVQMMTTPRGLSMGISSFDSRLGVFFALVQMMTTPRGLFMGISSFDCCLLYTSPSPRDKRQSRMPSSA